jgi:hypothetical protein
MSSKPLENEDLQNFLARSRDMVSMLAGVKVEPKEQKEEESASDDKSEENSVE